MRYSLRRASAGVSSANGTDRFGRPVRRHFTLTALQPHSLQPNSLTAYQRNNRRRMPSFGDVSRMLKNDGDATASLRKRVKR